MKILDRQKLHSIAFQIVEFAIEWKAYLEMNIVFTSRALSKTRVGS